eukprot:1911116-Amphidinium_carterae.2
MSLRGRAQFMDSQLWARAGPDIPFGPPKQCLQQWTRTRWPNVLRDVGGVTVLTDASAEPDPEAHHSSVDAKWFWEESFACEQTSRPSQAKKSSQAKNPQEVDG